MKIQNAKSEINKNGFIVINPNEIDFISKIQESGKYFLDLSPDKSKEWIIRKNPNYYNRTLHEIKAGFIGGIFALLVGIALWLIDRQSSRQELQELHAKILQIENKLSTQ